MVGSINLASLTAVQKTQLQLFSSLVAVVSRSLRHSLHNTSDPPLGWVPASEVPASELSRARFGLSLAMMDQGVQGGMDKGIRLPLSFLPRMLRSYQLSPCFWKQNQHGCICLKGVNVFFLFVSTVRLCHNAQHPFYKPVICSGDCCTSVIILLPGGKNEPVWSRMLCKI